MWNAILNVTSCKSCQKGNPSEPETGLKTPKIYKRLVSRKPSKAKELLKKSSGKILLSPNKYENSLQMINKPEIGWLTRSKRPCIREADFKTRFASVNSKFGCRSYNENMDIPLWKETMERARGQILKSKFLHGDIDNTPVFDEEKEEFYSYFVKQQIEENKERWQGEENKENSILESDSSGESSSTPSSSEDSKDSLHLEAYLKMPNWIEDLNHPLDSIQEVSNENGSSKSIYTHKVDKVRRLLLAEIDFHPDSRFWKPT